MFGAWRYNTKLLWTINKSKLIYFHVWTQFKGSGIHFRKQDFTLLFSVILWVSLFCKFSQFVGIKFCKKFGEPSSRINVRVNQISCSLSIIIWGIEIGAEYDEIPLIPGFFCIHVFTPTIFMYTVTGSDFAWIWFRSVWYIICCFFRCFTRDFHTNYW